MSTPVTLAIFGAGRWGYNLIRNFMALPDAHVAAVVDPDEPQLTAVAKRLALPESVQRLTDWRAAIAIPDLQAVVVATPATTHFPMIKAALERGLHVLTEKPMTLESETCQTLCELAERQGVQLVVDHTYLFHPAVERGKAAIAAGKLGDLRYGYATRTNLGPVRSDVDALWDLAIHDVAILNHWLDDRPVQAAAWGRVWLQPQARPDFTQGLADAGWIRLTYGSGFEAAIHVSWLNPDKQRRLGLVGSLGSLVFDELSESMLTLCQGHVEPEGKRFPPKGLGTQPLLVETAEPLRQVCQHFLDCVNHQRPSEISSGWVGRDLVQVQAAIATALATGDTIALP